MSASTRKTKRASWLTKLLARIKILLDGELTHLLTVNRSKRPWHMPIIATIAISFPVFVGAYFGALPSGIKASLGAMVILNTPLAGNLSYRLVTVMAWGFAMSLCFALGLIAQQAPLLKLPIFYLDGFWYRHFWALLSTATASRIVCDDGWGYCVIYTTAFRDHYASHRFGDAG